MFSFPPFEEIIWKYDYLFIYFFLFFVKEKSNEEIRIVAGARKG